MISIVLLRCDFNQELFHLTQLAMSSLKADEHILIDNASNVGENTSWPDTLIKNKRNVGYCAAVNQGMALSHGEFVAISNNDIRVSDNWKEVCEEIFKDKAVGSVHLRMIGYETPMELGGKTWIEGRERWCSASFFVIRKEAFLGYDEGYKEGGYDDWDFFYRLRKAGWKTAYTTKACYQHKHSSTYLAMDQGDRFERDMRNRERFRSKFGGYAEDLFTSQYPDQMQENYYEFFNQL